MAGKWSVRMLPLLALVLAGCPVSQRPVSMLNDWAGIEDTLGPSDLGSLEEVVVGPIGCLTNEDCESGVCNPFTYTCVECMTGNDCPAKHGCVKWQCVPLPECQEDGDCPEGTICWEEEQVCVECLEDGDCPDGLCVEQECRIPCDAGCPPGTVCDELTNLCVECLEDGDCLLAEWCFLVANECVADQCLPGTKGCVGNQVATCAANGSGWTDLSPCNDGLICVNGACQDDKICQPGLKSCKDEITVQTCNDAGTALIEEPCAKGLVCQNGKCVDGCVVNCEGQECGPSNCPGYECGQCDFGMVCENGKCLPGGCVEGESACVGNAVIICYGPDGWSEPMECPEGTFCEEGHCMGGPMECFPGEVGCEGMMVIYCSEDGIWLTGEMCPVGTFCSAGECQQIEPTPCYQTLECMMQFKLQEPDPWLFEKCVGPDGEQGMAFEIFYCVFESCGEWIPGSACFQEAMIGQCVELYQECAGICLPNCMGKECGSDGCGGSCGWCPDGLACVNGQCGGSETDCAQVMQCMIESPCPSPDPWMCLEMCSSPEEPMPELAVELFWCVTEMCGMWNPYEECFFWALQDACGWLYEECMQGGCEPQCAGKSCGDDGCGSVCGWCPDGLVCSVAGKCTKPCEPQCWGADGTVKQCGSDGCGGSCGVCPAGSSCSANGVCVQVCKPNCENKKCGSDGCGGSCGLCGVDEACQNGKCVKSLSCQGLLDCYWDCPEDDDGCYLKCWQDSSPAAKQQWQALGDCIAKYCGADAPPACSGQVIQGVCKPQWNACQSCTPACLGKSCGPDGCDGSCGSCPAGFVCDNYGGCICQPQCAGIECGNDGCGGSCGSCPKGKLCNFLGYCVCEPQCTGKECGADGCGGVCGYCQPGYTCNANGICKFGGSDKCGNGICDSNLGESCQSCPIDCPCTGSCCQEHETPGCDDANVMECVCNLDTFCCEVYWDGLCVMQATDQCGGCGGCQPNCLNKECGSDGCSGSCGTCPVGSSCSAGGICVQSCKPDCTGKQCGSNGCGGVCGVCGPQQACKDGKCITSLTCEEILYCLWECPPESETCGEKCWQYASPAAKQQWLAMTACVEQVCGEDAPDNCWEKAISGQCESVWNQCMDCTPQCVGKQCGENGCGGNCGNCPGGYVCDSWGYCICQPQCQGKVCGNDGCGGSCGTCPTNSVCNYLGQCVCLPQCLDKECGNDGCGGSCGKCGQGMVCTPGGKCKEDPCGNGKCQADLGETCQSCPADCGPCYPEGDCCVAHDWPGCEIPEVMYCVCEMDPFCCNNDWDESCVKWAMECGAFCCEPNCWNKQCGSDGCGGSCGACPVGMFCNANGQCTGSSSCGNGWCQSWQGEDCNTCPQDCGSCSSCGDGMCDYAMESCIDCPEDCGPCVFEGDCCKAHNEPGCEQAEVVYCTCQMDPYCCQSSWDEICVTEAKESCGLECDDPCVPQCYFDNGQKKQCGSDGCGGVCGYCAPNASCVNGKCVTQCVPQCMTADGQKLECGPDGCGGVCGYCKEGIACVNGKCANQCVPNCTIFGFPKQCGSDGCGGSCGTCPAGTACDSQTFQCVNPCVPQCQGKACGSDGCGGSCGACAPGEECINGQCASNYNCSAMLDCAINCNFQLNCTMACSNGGDQQSKAVFQQLAMCVAQVCAPNFQTQCVIKAMQGSCASQYQACLSDK